MNDEKYFTYDGSNMQGNDNYYTNDISKCSDSVRFAGKEKYPHKVMDWVAKSNRGISKTLFCPSKSEAVDSESTSTNGWRKGCSYSSSSIIQT